MNPLISLICFCLYAWGDQRDGYHLHLHFYFGIYSVFCYTFYFVCKDTPVLIYDVCLDSGIYDSRSDDSFIA